MSYCQMQREWLDHPALQGDPYCRRAAWAWLIVNANWKDGREFANGEMLTIKRGQLIHSVRFLAEKWGWTIGKVQRFLCRLKTDTMVDTQVLAGRMVITICNYEKYQSSNKVSKKKADTPSDTATIQQRYKEEEGKEVKKKDNPLTPLPDWLNHEAWGGFVEMRRKGGNPLTPYAVKLAINELTKLKQQGHDPTTVIEQSISRGWKTFYPLKPPNGFPARMQTKPPKSNVRTL